MAEKVSIIIPCYNQGKYIADAINSGLAQTYSNIEIVCINDGSNDESANVIKAFSDKYKNVLFIDEQDNSGIIHARNKAIELCSGEYILPLDADDTIEPTYIEKAVKILEANSNIGIVYCKARMFGDKNQSWNLDDFNKSNILYKNCIFCTALFRKSDFIKIGKYKDYMKHGCEDFDLWLSFLEHGFDVYRIDETLFNYRQHNEVSRTKIGIQYRYNVWEALIKNHINLYLNDKQFYERLIFLDPINTRKKYLKYKKIFNALLPIAIIELVLLVVIVVVLILKEVK